MSKLKTRNRKPYEFTLSDGEKDFIDEAVQNSGSTRSGFVREASIERATTQLGRSLNDHLNATRKLAA